MAIPEQLRLAAQMVVLLYAVAAMILVGMTKIGNLMGAMTKTTYRPESTNALRGWSRRTKVIHAVVIVAAALIAFWPFN